MRVLIDTSVWIEHFQPGETPGTRALRQSIAASEELCTTGVIVFEVLAGIQRPTLRAWVRRTLHLLTLLVPDAETHLEALDLVERAEGVEAATNDWLLVALSRQHRVRLLYSDPVFDAIHEVVWFPRYAR